MRKALLMSTVIVAMSNVALAAATEWPASASAPAAAAQTLTAPVIMPKARDGEIIDSVGSGAIDAQPLTVMSNGTMKYVTGGIGDEETAQLKSLESTFNIQMLIAGTDGHFIGDALVKVVDTKDTVLFTVENAGPYFYLSLPAGDYMVEVTTGGAMKSVKVKAPASGAIKPVVRF